MKRFKKMVVFVISTMLLVAAMAVSTLADCNSQFYGYASVDYASVAEYDVVVTVPEYIALRTAPGAEHDIIMRPSKGQKLHIYQSAVNYYDGRIWGLTVIDGQYGWVSLSWTSRCSSSVYNNYKDVVFYNNRYNAVVCSSDGFLNFRSGAGMAYSIITPIYNGTSLYITQVVLNSADNIVWGYTYYNGMYGWVAMEPTMIQDMDDACRAEYNVTVTNSSNLIIRKGPGTEYDPLTNNIPNNTVLKIDRTVINSFDGRPWGRTSYNGIVGWVSLDWTYRAPGIN